MNNTTTREKRSFATLWAVCYASHRLFLDFWLSLILGSLEVSRFCRHWEGIATDVDGFHSVSCDAEICVRDKKGKNVCA